MQTVMSSSGGIMATRCWLWGVYEATIELCYTWSLLYYVKSEIRREQDKI